MRPQESGRAHLGRIIRKHMSIRSAPKAGLSALLAHLQQAGTSSRSSAPRSRYRQKQSTIGQPVPSRSWMLGARRSTSRGTFLAHSSSRGRTSIQTRSSRCSRVQQKSRRCLQRPVLHPGRLPSRIAKSVCGPAFCISRLGTLDWTPETMSVLGVTGRPRGCPPNQCGSEEVAAVRL
jgi:hypothetical protein